MRFVPAVGRPSGRRRWRRMAAAALATGLAGGALLLAVPSGAGLPPDVWVIDSHAAAAAVGVVSRFPAESGGGAAYTSTAISLDKAQARAAGFTGGDLVEAFLQSSNEQYRNPALINAQYPPTATVPAESRFDAAAAPKDAPAGGGTGSLHAVATEAPSAAAEAAGAQATLGDVAVGGATSESASRLAADGTLVTTARSTATDVRIAKVLAVASASTVAEATVPRSGAPATTLDVKLAGVALAGIPAEITPEGLSISDKAAASPVTTAQFNAALAQLQEQGITVTAAPLVQESGAGGARASGGGVRIRYKVADQIGGDEELILAPASARSAIARRDADAPALDGPVPPAVDGATPGGEGAPPAGAGYAAGDRPGASSGFQSGDGLGGVGAATADAPGTSSTFDAGDPLSRVAAAPGEASGSDPFGAAGASGPPDAGTGGPPPAAGPGSSETALPAAHRRDPAGGLRTGYSVLLLAAAAGLAAVIAQSKARTT